MSSSFWHGRSVFVTGATGLVGSALAKDLVVQGAHVTALVRDHDPQSEFFRAGTYRQISIVNGSLEDYRSLERAVNEHEAETVFHLAAQPIVGVAYRSPLPTFEANIRGTYNLLEACRAHKSIVRRLVVASSDKAYGDQAVLPYTEDMPLLGRHPYDVSKACADLLSQSYAQIYDLPIAIARCGNVYGEGDRNWNRIVPGTIQACLLRERPVIRSDGSPTRDYIYVKDVSSAYLSLAEGLGRAGVQGQAFNFGPRAPVSVLDLVYQIQKLMGCEHFKPDVRGTASGEIQAQYLDSRKAEKILGWRPQYGLIEGLSETISWYREQFTTRTLSAYTAEH